MFYLEIFLNEKRTCDSLRKIQTNVKSLKNVQKIIEQEYIKEWEIEKIQIVELSKLGK